MFKRRSMEQRTQFFWELRESDFNAELRKVSGNL